MKANERLVAIYDFEFFPYALGDVLTWNVRTAMRCQELGKSCVDIYLCVDEEFPASIYQKGLVNPDNFELFFSEIYGAFGTNPKLGNIYVFRQREALLERLKEATAHDKDNMEIYHDYLYMLKKRVPGKFLNKILVPINTKVRASVVLKKLFNYILPQTVKEAVRSNISHEYALNNFFIKYVYSHESINEFVEKHGDIPLLQPSLGCVPDVDEIIARRFQGKKIVPFHLRLRRLDVGYGGDHSYERDSDFLEWYDFLKAAGEKYPDVQFVALGRLQEKPLEILRLPNVASLRVYGMGLGHELTLMLKSDLFIGSSSGFAAFANFSSLPYFITKMNPGSCKAYAIPDGSEKLPFAKENQKLVYAEETSSMLMKLLVDGLSLTEAISLSPVSDVAVSKNVNVSEWLKLHMNPANDARTTCRFYNDKDYRQNETAYLLLPYLNKARQAYILGDYQKSERIISKMHGHFPELCEDFLQFWLMRGCVAAHYEDASMFQLCLSKLEAASVGAAIEKILALFHSISEKGGDATNLVDELRGHIMLLNFEKAAL